MTITLTTTVNQKNDTNNNNKTSIYLEQCETLLREYYNISDDQLIYIKKIDVIQEGMKITKVEYDVYTKLFGENLTKLNLSICENAKISITVPVKINENIDILNSSSEYYKDICYKSKSDSGTDIIINDRKKEFVEDNKTVCQEYCDFSDYIYNIQKANCSCRVKESSMKFADMNINKTKLYENFGDNNNKMDVSNLGLMTCNVLSSKENIESNTGFYLLLLILVTFVIIFIIFYIKGYNSLENKIDDVIYKKFKNEAKLEKINKLNTNEVIKPSKKIKKRKIKKSKKKISSNKSNITNNLFLNENKNKKNNIPKNISSILETNDIKNKTSDILLIKPDTDYEFNWLSYEDALRYDKRSSCEYYISLIKNKQLFLFTFCSFNDYNSGIIKKFMLFLSFALHYTVNALFFDDSNMHQIYEDEGKFNFGYQIPYILFSMIISNLIMRLMLHFLVLTDKDILQVKLQPNKKAAINMKPKKLKCMKKKFAIFFILNFILLILFWYYLTSFNGIYQNTQTYLIENTFISFGFSLFYPFIFNIVPTITRMNSINSSKKRKSYLYKVSQILQII